MSITGRFYFKQTDSGNLIGEFSNNKMIVNSTESADIVKIKVNVFIGDYKSSWIENGEVELLNLRIELKTNTKIYKLIWFKANAEEPAFWGEGFLVDKMLIGNYQDFPIE